MFFGVFRVSNNMFTFQKPRKIIIVILLMSCGWVSIGFGTMFLSINFLRVYGRKQIEISYEKNVNLGSMKTALAYPLWENTLKISHMGLRHLLCMEIFLKGSYSYDMGPRKRLLFL